MSNYRLVPAASPKGIKEDDECDLSEIDSEIEYATDWHWRTLR